MLNLTFHGLGQPSRRIGVDEQGVWLSREQFELVLNLVKDRLDVRLTFDDGNESDFQIGLPLLLHLGMKATFFVCVGLLDKDGYLASSQVQRLSSAGMTIGSHGMYHRDWRNLSLRALHDELVQSKLVLEELIGRTVSDVSCPFGSFDRRVLRSLRNAGYAKVFTSDRAPARSDAWLQPRHTVRSRDLNGNAAGLLSGKFRMAQLIGSFRTTVKSWR
jgi:peptidoglycan/xylan/chitin deacetylase (PgdA/CDA1 family)